MSTERRARTRLASFLAIAACTLPMQAHEAAAQAERGISAEADPADRTGKASRDPLAAWQAARAALPAGHQVRRLAFAPHGLNVFSTVAGAETPVRVVFLQWTGDGYTPSDPESRDDVGCEAPGATPEQVDRALLAMTASTAWRDHVDQVGTLLLECLATPKLYWNVLIEPAGGYQAGVPIETQQLPFTPGAPD